MARSEGAQSLAGQIVLRIWKGAVAGGSLGDWLGPGPRREEVRGGALHTPLRSWPLLFSRVEAGLCSLLGCLLSCTIYGTRNSLGLACSGLAPGSLRVPVGSEALGRDCRPRRGLYLGLWRASRGYLPVVGRGGLPLSGGGRGSLLGLKENLRPPPKPSQALRGLVNPGPGALRPHSPCRGCVPRRASRSGLGPKDLVSSLQLA